MQKINRMLPAITALILGLGLSAEAPAAENCATSFYCYGDSSKHVSITPTRPAPLPPPNTNYIRQRHLAQHAARNPSTRTHPAARAATLRQTTPAHRVAAPQVTVRAVPPTRSHTQPRTVTGNHTRSHNSHCQMTRQRMLERASELESLAVTNARRGQRQRSVILFRDAAKMRSNAQRMNCR